MIPGQDVRAADRAMVEQYLDQPAAIPDSVRRRVETVFDRRPVQLYALADLDESMHLARRWIALGEERVAVAREDRDEVQVIERSAIRAIRRDAGLSCSALRLLGEEGEPPLAVIRFTHRQKPMMGNIEFVLNRALEGELLEMRGDDDAVYLEALTGPVKSTQATVAGNELAVIWRLLGYLRPYQSKVLLGMLAALLLAVASLVPPYLTGVLVDDIVEPFQSGEKGRESAWNQGILLVTVISGAYVLRLLFLWVRLHVMAILGEFVAHDMRRDAYNKVQQLSVRYFSKNQTGSILSRVGSDTDRIWEFVAFGVVEVSLSAITVAALSAVLLAMDWRLGLVMVTPVPLMVWAVVANGRKMQSLYTRAWRKWSSLNDVIADTIPGIRVVKAFHQEEQEKQRFGRRNREMLETFNLVHANWTKFWPTLMLTIHGISIAIYWLALPRLLSDPSSPAHLTLGTLVAFLLFMGMFFQPIEVFGQMARMLNRALSSARRVFDLIDTEPETMERRGAIDPGKIRGDVEFRDVYFGYESVRPVLRGITFKVAAGEMIGIVGPSGAGKTTLVNLIARFYAADSGGILVDDIDLREMDLGAFRRQLGMVQQESFLFHGTILDNIRYGSPQAKLERVIEAARAADAHEFICRLPHGYDTLVGEHGGSLSGGERQRIAIARAILHDPRILILDEALSNVDLETEARIQTALERVIRGRTTFVIAHRLSTLKQADRILVIKEGRLVESGTHEALLARKEGVYRRMNALREAGR